MENTVVAAAQSASEHLREGVDYAGYLVQLKKPAPDEICAFSAGETVVRAMSDGKVEGIVPVVAEERVFWMEESNDLIGVVDDSVIQYIAPNYIYHLGDEMQVAADTVPNSEQIGWHLTQTDGFSLVRNGQSPDMTKPDGTRVKIAVLDTGIFPDHQEFTNYLQDYNNGIDNFGFGYAAYSHQPQDMIEGARAIDNDNHGTFVSGLIAAKNNNKVGMKSLGENAQLYVGAVMGGAAGTDATIIQGINWAVKKGVDVINLSLGGPNYNPVTAEAVKRAIDQNIIVVASAGNEADGLYGSTIREFTDRNGVKHLTSPNYISYPAGFDGVIGVGGVNDKGVKAYFAHYNESVDVTAPAEGIYSTGVKNTGSYAWNSGTSFSSPQVAALAGLCKAQWPSMTPAQFEEILKETSQRKNGTTEKTPEYGWGIIQCAKAVNLAAKKAEENPEEKVEENPEPLPSVRLICEDEQISSGTITASSEKAVKVSVSTATGTTDNPLTCYIAEYANENTLVGLHRQTLAAGTPTIVAYQPSSETNQLRVMILSGDYRLMAYSNKSFTIAELSANSKEGKQ